MIFINNYLYNQIIKIIFYVKKKFMWFNFLLDNIKYNYIIIKKIVLCLKFHLKFLHMSLIK